MTTVAQLRVIASGKPKASKLNPLLIALNTYGIARGLDRQYRLT